MYSWILVGTLACSYQPYMLSKIVKIIARTVVLFVKSLTLH